MKNLCLVSLVFVFFLLNGCKNRMVPDTEGFMNPDSIPLQVFRDTVKMSMTENGKKLWSLAATNIVRYKTGMGTIVFPVDIIYYTKTGTSHLKADTGLISPSMDTLEALGNVEVKTYDHKTVTTSRIIWYKATDKVVSDRFVKMVTTEGDAYSGIGFVANTNLSEWKILKNVKAKILNVNKGLL